MPWQSKLSASRPKTLHFERQQLQPDSSKWQWIMRPAQFSVRVGVLSLSLSLSLRAGWGGLPYLPIQSFCACCE